MLPRRRRSRRSAYSPGDLKLSELAQFRKIAYTLFSFLFLYPTDERLREVVVLAQGLGGEDEPLSTFPFYTSWRELVDAAKRLKPEAVQGEYGNLFLGCGSCLACESAYLGREAPAMTVVSLDQEYASCGFALSADLEEPPDHAGVELAFMSLLCEKEESAWRTKNVADALSLLGRERGFLERHLCRWFPEFAGCVRSKGSGVYARAAEAARIFMASDGDLLDAILNAKLEQAGGARQ